MKLRIAKKVFKTHARIAGRFARESKPLIGAVFPHHRQTFQRAARRMLRAIGTHGSQQAVGFWSRAFNAELRTDDVRRVR